MNNEQTKIKVAKLEIKITSARKRLQSLWNAKGCTDAEVLNASIELDPLINEYERLFREEQRG